jgi:hypothetical protein
MTVAEYSVALASVAVVVAGAGAVGRAVAQRLVPDVDRVVWRLAVTVAAVSFVVVDAEILGTLGVLYRGELVATAAVAGGVAWALRRRLPGRAGTAGEGDLAELGPVVLVVWAVVTAQWLSRTLVAYGHGMTDYDTLHYHLSQAARFAHGSPLLRPVFTTPDAPVQFHPANAELLHSVGMALTGRDVLSPALNLGWLAVTFMGAWCLGRAVRRPAPVLLAVALVAALPVLAASQAGSAENDLAALALFLAAVAFVSVLGSGSRAVAGLGAGLALGTKLSLVGPVVALTVGVVVIDLVRRRRLVSAGAAGWVAALVVTGAFWYLRDLLYTGSPVPGADLPFLPHTANLIGDKYGFSVASYATDAAIWRHWFLPGLRWAFGPLWFVTLAVGLAGILVGAVRPGRSGARLLAAVAAVSAVVYAETPSAALGFHNQPVFFEANLRYATPALLAALLGLVLARRVSRSAMCAGVAVFVATELGARSWPRDGGAVAGVGIAVVLGVGLWTVVRRLPRHRASAALLIAAAVLAGYAGQRFYFTHRYADDELAAWAGRQHGARIAIAGFDTQYPLLGPDLSNRVQYVGHHGPVGEFTVARSCAEWRRQLRDGRYQYVVTGTVLQLEYDHREPPEAEWTRRVPGTTEVLHAGPYTVLRVGSDPDPRTCA